MRETKKDVISNHDKIAYFSGCGGIEIHHISYGINDYVYFISNAWNGKPRNKAHKCKIYYNGENPYFICNGYKIPLNECIKWGI